jgi:uncharacterized protein YecT (DUF1311 family)
MLWHHLDAMQFMRLILSPATVIAFRQIIFIATLGLVGEVCSAATLEQTIEECWVDHDHPAMANCVAARASEARARLVTVERRMLAAIDASPESPRYVAKARSAFARSARSYATYRNDQCSLRAALAATGNGSYEVGRACEAVLDAGRADQLEATM